MVNKVSFFKTTNLSRGLPSYTEKAVIYFFGFLLILSLSALSNDSFFLPFVPEKVEGLQSMAAINSKTGRSSKKTSIDSLWLPTTTEQIVYSGDALFTNSDSTLVITLNKNAKLFVEPDSYLRIREIDGAPLIRLSKGSIKAEVTNEQVLYIKKGALIEKAILQKGTYFIKNDQTAGIQITAFDQITNLSQGNEENQNKMKSSLAEEDPEPELADKSKDELKHQEKEHKADLQFDLPTPIQGTVFLVKNKKDIAIGASTKCPDTCSMNIYFNQNKILSKEFNTHQLSVITLAADKVLDGYYEWTFETETSQFKSDFKVIRYSDEELSAALSAGTPVEVQY